MKYILTITLTFIAFILGAQSGTTLDEYRYLSKGYAYQLEMGLDPTKNGYEIRDNYIAKDGTKIIGLYRIDGKLPQGLLFMTTDSNGKSYYQALPNPSSADNVLALYRQDRLQPIPKSALDRISAAKDQYLFSMVSGSESQDIAQVPREAFQPTKDSQPSVSKRPRSYEKTPEPQDEQLTAKGGTTILPKEKPMEVSEKIVGGTVVTGQLNAELNSMIIRVHPQTRNTTKAKGRVMIKFCADAEGKVTYAKFTQKGSTTLNSQLKKLALAAVLKMRLGPSSDPESCGTVGFDF